MIQLDLKVELIIQLNLLLQALMIQLNHPLLVLRILLNLPLMELTILIMMTPLTHQQVTKLSVK